MVLLFGWIFGCRVSTKELSASGFKKAEAGFTAVPVLRFLGFFKGVYKDCYKGSIRVL